MPEVQSEARTFDLTDCQFTTTEAAAHLRVSRSYLYELIAAKKIRRVKLGKRTLIQGRELKRFMNSLAA
jgi:excisionase family DNA binding protein